MYSEKEILLKWLQEYTTISNGDLREIINAIDLNEAYEIMHFGNYKKFTKEAVLIECSKGVQVIDNKKYDLSQTSQLLYSFSDDDRIGYKFIKSGNQKTYEPFFAPDCESIIAARYDYIFDNNGIKSRAQGKAINCIYHYSPGMEDLYTSSRHIQGIELELKIVARFPNCKINIVDPRRHITALEIDGDILGYEYYKGSQLHLSAKSDKIIERYLEDFEKIMGSNYLYRRYRPEKNLWYYRWYDLSEQMQQEYENDYRKVEKKLEKEWENL